MRLRKSIVVLISFSIILASSILPKTVDAQTSISYYSPYPQGTIGINQPEIGWTVLLGDNRVENADFILNGLPIEVIYDEEKQTFVASSLSPLTGENTVQATVKLVGWGNLIVENWSFTVDEPSIGAYPLQNEKQLQALDAANNYRYLLDLPLFQLDDSLSYTAQKHTEYQSDLGKITHYQEEGNQGFFGVTVGDRANYYGFYGNIYEDIALQHNINASEAIKSLFDAPYHRIPFLIPANKYYGYGVSDNYHVLNFGYFFDLDSKVVIYPGENEINVPISWENYETPDPLRLYNDANKLVGYPIVVGVYGDGVSNIKVKSANIWDSKDNEIAFYLNSPLDTGGNDEHLSNEIILIPKTVLDYSQYRVQLELEYLENGLTKTYDNTWYFTTATTSTTSKIIKFKLGQNYVWVDNTKKELDVEPFIKSSRTMVPFRALAESLGASVDWNSKTKTVIYQKDNHIIELPIGVNYVFVNGEKVQLDQGAIIKDGRSFVPSRFISERLGAKVDWIPKEKEVIITLKSVIN